MLNSIDRHHLLLCLFSFSMGGLEKGFYTALLLMDAKKKRFATSSHTLAIYIHVYVY